MIDALRVLIVGDRRETGGLADSFRACETTATSVPDLGAAERVLGNGGVDVLFLGMTQGDSLDVLRDALSMDPDLPVIAILGQGSTSTPDVLRAGAYDTLALPIDCTVLEAALHRAQAAILNRRSEVEQRRHSRDMATLQQATSAIVSSLRTDDVLSGILAETTHILGAERASVLLRDERAGDLRFYVTAGGVQDLSGIRVPSGAGLANWCIDNDAADLANCAHDDPRFYSGVDEVLDFETRSLVVAPLRGRGRVVGALEAINKTDGEFDAHDLFLLSALALSASAALGNSSRYVEQMERRELLRSLLDAAGSAMVAVDKAGEVLFLNPAGSAILAVSEAEAEGRDLVDLLAKRGDLSVLEPATATLADYRDAVLSAEKPLSFTIQVDAGETMALDSIVSPIRLGCGTTVARLVVWRDITKELQLARWREDLSQIILHDLRNPLSLVRVGVEAAQLFLPDDPSVADAQKGLVLALQGVAQLERRTEILLAVNLLESGLPLENMGPVSLGQVARDAETFYGFEAAERGVSMSVDVPADLVSVHGDPDLLEWTVGNLIYYALKHSPRPAEVIVRGVRRGDDVVLSVMCSAMRLSQDALNYLFAKLNPQERRRQVGTSGIGLHFCWLVAQAHGGSIEASSSDDQGVRFDLALPIDGPAESAG
jgi:PAS domain S-box-containing protein